MQLFDVNVSLFVKIKTILVNIWFVVYCLEENILTDKESISFVISDAVILFTGCDLSWLMNTAHSTYLFRVP